MKKYKLIKEYQGSICDNPLVLKWGESSYDTE